MADLSNEDLKNILLKRIEELENSNNKTQNIINPENINSLLKALALPSDFAPLAQKVFELAPRTKVIWLHLAECTGCSESLLRTQSPNLAELIFDFISLEYHETLMLASGWQAEDSIEKLLEFNEDFILAVEGGVAPIDTYFLTIGANAESGFELLQKVASKAKAIFAMGTCSSYGGIQAAQPNPTKCCGIQEVLSQKIVQVPGCPPSDINIIANLCFYALFQTLPNLDEKNRPKWAYGKCLHDMCERKAKFESGIFAQNFDDDLAKNGACLFKIGCKGPYTYNNCPKIKFNSKTSWPVQAGHGCMACSEPHFWDDFGVYERAMANEYAYKDFSFKSPLNEFLNTIELKENLDDESILLSLKEQTQILYKNANEASNFLKFEFESNLKLILQSLSKNKIGASLVENYRKDFSQNYAFIEANFDELPKPSSDLSKLFELFYILAKGEFLKDEKSFLSFAASYKFKHPSPLDFKLSLNENEAKLDISKSFRMPLIYLCGGLDLEALAFSLVHALSKNLSEALQFLSQKEGKRISLCLDEKFNDEFLKANFSKCLS